MHLLAAQPGAIEDGADAVDLGQSPGDIVLLSAADTELACFAQAQAGLGAGAPTLRLANLMQLGHNHSVDRYAEQVIAGARLVIVRLLGGESYWPYGVERLTAVCEGRGIPIAWLPGDDKPDAGLATRSTLAPEAAETLWRYCTHGGLDNARNALRYAATLIGREADWRPPRPVPRAGLYWPGEGVCALEDVMAHWRDGTPKACVVFYRALLQGGSLAPVDALVAALREAGLDPLPVFVTSLRDATGGGADRHAHAHDGARDRAQRHGLRRLPPRRAAGDPVRRGRRARAASHLRRRHRAAVGGGDARPLAPRHRHERGAARGRRADSHPRGGVQDRGALRRGHASAHRGLGSERGALPLRRRPCRRLGAPRARGTGGAPHRPGARQLPQPRRAHRQRRRPRYAGEHGAHHGRPRRCRLPGGRRAGGRRRADGEAPGRPHQRRRDPRQTGRRHAPPRRLRALLRRPARGRAAAVTERWGGPETDPFFRPDDGCFALPVQRFGNVVVAIQPARGYNIDPEKSYHDPDLPPPHGYLAFYAWLRGAFDAHAVVHVGKHGNVEWLPGKALALSAECFPEAALGPLPHVYPFIVNDPGEGSQAKRRGAAVIVDHLTPPLTRAGSHGALEELERLVDEFFDAASVDPRRCAPSERAHPGACRLHRAG